MSVASLLNDMNDDDARDALSHCCGAKRWFVAMNSRRPFVDQRSLEKAADDVWADMNQPDILEAFSHHPKIGEDVEELRKKFASTADLAAGEQSGVDSASDDVLERLRSQNVAYEKRFGYIFIVCASGKSAPEMLALLEERISNEPDAELDIAAGEQAKITKLRLEKIAL